MESMTFFLRSAFCFCCSCCWRSQEEIMSPTLFLQQSRYCPYRPYIQIGLDYKMGWKQPEQNRILAASISMVVLREWPEFGIQEMMMRFQDLLTVMMDLTIFSNLSRIKTSSLAQSQSFNAILGCFQRITYLCPAINKIRLKIKQFYSMDREKSKPRLLSRAATLDAGLAPQEDELEQGVFIPQPHVHQFILSEFKEKYDQLKSAFEAKKKEADGLLYDKKKLEIELLNHNVEYYEKEIGRLRGELQRYQLENEENKHRFFVAENSRKDLQATSKVRHQQLRQALKQLQREKISVVQLKHQLTETTRNYTNVIAQVQNNNHLLSQKYDQTATALLKAEAQLKTLKGSLQQVRSKCESLEKTLKEKEQQEAAFNEKTQLSEYRSKHRIEDLQEEIKDLSTKQSQKINHLEAQVKQLESQRKSEEFLLAQKEEAASYAQQLRKKQEQAARLQQKLREFTFSLSEREQKVQSLEQQLKNVCSIDLLNESQQRQAQALSSHKAIERALQSKLLSVQRELEMTKIQSPMGLMNQAIGLKADFQQLLRTQIEQNTRLKQSLSSKIDQAFTLRASIEQQHVHQSLLQNQLDILRKKQRAQQKNSKIGYEIELQNLKNDVDSLRRKVEVTETKLAIKTKQVKDKDAFICSVIIGRSRQEDVPFVVAQLKRVFQADYVSKLAEANSKIEHLQGRA